MSRSGTGSSYSYPPVACRQIHGPMLVTSGLTNSEFLDLHLVSVCSYAGDAGKDRSVIG